MTLLIGTDEAGYGPNLGPLLIGATAWRVSGDSPEVDLSAQLAGMVDRVSSEERFAIADSKALYSSGSGLVALEQTVLTSLVSCGGGPRTWREMWCQVTPRLAEGVLSEPWHAEYDEPLPLEAQPDWLASAAERWTAGLKRAQVELLAVEAEALFPSEFNHWVAKYDSKGAVLSLRTLQLIASVLQRLDSQGIADRRILIQCDKHGGRNSYRAVLQTIFPDYLPEVVREGRESSVYRWGPPERRVEIRFTAKGESFLPTALASMHAKYLRELAMRAFNAYWQRQVPGLRPTAGYPVDAKRFLLDIVSRQRELGIADDLLWRTR